MTSVERAIGQGVRWTTIGTVADKILVLVNVLIVLKYLSVYNYGIAELVFSILSTVGIILLPGLSTTIIADMGVERGKGDHHRMKSIFHQYLVLNVALSVLAFAFLFFGSQIVAGLSGNSSIGYFIRIVSLTFLIAPVRVAALVIATVHVRFVDQAVYSIIEEVAKFFALIVFFFGFHMHTEGLLYAYIISQAAGALAFLPRTLSGYREFSHATAEGAHRFWEVLGTHRKWSVAASYVGTLTQNLQIWLIKLILGTEAVGLFAFANGIMSNVASLLPFTSVFTSLAPRYAERRDEFLRLLEASVKAQFLLSLALVVLTIVLLPVLIWFIPKYAPANGLTLVLILVLIPTSITGVYTPVFAILKRQLSYFVTMCVKFALTGVVLTISILAFGIIGVGVGTVALNILSGVERYWRLRQSLPEYRFSLRQLVTISKDDKRIIEELVRGLPLIRRLMSFQARGRV